MAFEEESVTIYAEEYSVVVRDDDVNNSNTPWRVLTATYASDPEAGLIPTRWSFVPGTVEPDGSYRSATLCLADGSTQELEILAHEPIFLRVKFKGNMNCQQLTVNLG